MSRSFATGLTVTLCALFVLSCQTSAPFNRSMYPDPVFPFSKPLRGALIDAVPMEPVRADDIRETADLMTDFALSGFFDTSVLKENGYFSKYAIKRNTLANVLPVRIHFWSEDNSGRPIRLSAGLFLPLPAEGQIFRVPLVSWSHGTETVREAVPSRLDANENYLTYLLASTGFAIVADDFPGLGDSDGYHPYCNDRALGTSGVDAMRAAREFMDRNATRWIREDRNYVYGYSEGGYAAMAIAKNILTDADLSKEFPVAAVMPMAGPFDLTGVMLPLMIDNVHYSHPGFFTLMAFGFAQTDALPVEKVISKTAMQNLIPFFDGRSSARNLDDIVLSLEKKAPGTPVSEILFNSDWLSTVRNPATRDADYSFNVLKKNNLYSWEPQVPADIILAHSRTDEVVPYANSVHALEGLKGHGAQVKLIDLQGKNHIRGGFEGILLGMAIMWDYESR